MKLTLHEQKILDLTKRYPSIIYDINKRHEIAKKYGFKEKTIRNRIADLKKYGLISFKEKNLRDLYKINKRLNLGLLVPSTWTFSKIIKKAKLKLIKFLILEKKFLTTNKLNKVKKNYKDLGISTLEIESEFHKALAYPLFLMCMTIIAGLFVLGIESRKSYLFYVFLLDYLHTNFV